MATGWLIEKAVCIQAKTKQNTNSAIANEVKGYFTRERLFHVWEGPFALEPMSGVCTGPDRDRAARDRETLRDLM